LAAFGGVAQKYRNAVREGARIEHYGGQVGHCQSLKIILFDQNKKV